MLHVIVTQLKFLTLPSFCLWPPPPPFFSLSLLSHTPTYIHTQKRTCPHTHVVYTTHLLTKYKQRVIDRSLHPASSVCVLIFSAGPASLVHSVHDELLHGSSFFLPSPSPLWPCGRNGKTSLVNYLCVQAAPATYHTAGQECEAIVCLCECIVCMCVCVSGSAPWQHRNVCRSITSQEHTLSEYFYCWV